MGLTQFLGGGEGCLEFTACKHSLPEPKIVGGWKDVSTIAPQSDGMKSCGLGSYIQC